MLIWFNEVDDSTIHYDCKKHFYVKTFTSTTDILVPSFIYSLEKKCQLLVIGFNKLIQRSEEVSHWSRQSFPISSSEKSSPQK